MAIESNCWNRFSLSEGVVSEIREESLVKVTILMMCCRILLNYS